MENCHEVRISSSHHTRSNNIDRSEQQNECRRGEGRIGEEEHVQVEECHQQVKRDWQDHVQHWRSTLAISLKNLFHHKEDRISGLTHKRHIGNANGVFRAREIQRLECQDRWDKAVINSVIGMPWRTTDSEWTAARPEIQVDLTTIPPLPLEGARIQGERIQRSLARLTRHLKRERQWEQVFEHGEMTKKVTVLMD